MGFPVTTGIGQVGHRHFRSIAKSLITSIVILLVALASLPRAVAADPPELLTRRAEYLKASRRAQIQPLSDYLRSLEPLRQQFAREGKADAAQAVATEMKSIEQQLAAAQSNADATTSAPVQLQIESATYGHHQTKRVADVTVAVRSALESGSRSITIATKDLGLQGADPSPGAHKTAVITYTINGRRKQKIVDENTVLDFKDLK
jgi:hypothetical protein